MPRRKSLVTVIRDMVRERVREAIQGVAGERESEEEGHERAQTAAQASRARTAARVEDADTQRPGASTELEDEQAARTGQALATRRRGLRAGEGVRSSASTTLNV